MSTQGTPTPCSGKDMLTQLRKAHSANRLCADCGASDPTWVSLSLGVLICIECSGVHRSLGSHISKVRSFELDHWEAMNEIKAGSISNADTNAELEAVIPIGREKPSATSDRETRERWILDKYVHKKFAKKDGKCPITPNQMVSLTLSETQLPPLHSPNLSTSCTIPISALSPTSSPRSPPLFYTQGISSRDPSLLPNELVMRLPPGFSEFSSARTRTPNYSPTSHIGSNVFAKKTPYTAVASYNAERRGSLASFLAVPQSQMPTYNRATMRRNSMFHS